MKWHGKDKIPKTGRRVVSLQTDGSGAELFYICADGMVLTPEGTKCTVKEADLRVWAYIPAGLPYVHQEYHPGEKAAKLVVESP
jgi:hypothetical protein